MKKKFFLLAIILFFALGGAAAFLFSGQNPQAAEERVPALSIPQIAEPDVSRAFIPPAQVPSSWVSLPVEMSLDDLQSLANRRLMRQFNGDNEYLDGTIKGKLNYAVERNNDVKVSSSNGELKIAIPAKFRVKFVGSVLAAIVRVPFSTQTDGEVNLVISLKPSIRRDWSIKTEAKVDMQWIKAPRLRVAGMQIGLQREATKFFSDAVNNNLPKLEEELNRAVDLRAIMQREWDNLSVPFKIAESFWLFVDPRAVSAPPLEILSEKAVLRACIEAGLSVSMSTGDIPQARKKNLPPLGTTLPVNDEIIIDAKALLTFDALAAEAMKALAPLKIDLGVAEVGVKSVSFAGDGERVLGTVEIYASSAEGKIYFVGKPYFDESTRTLSVRDFDLAPASRTGLAQSAAWLLKPIFIDSIREKLSWQVGPQIDRLLKSARDAVAKRDLSAEMELKGSIGNTKFQNLRVSEKGIELGLALTGKASLTYRSR